jgi:hypothetical protein
MLSAFVRHAIFLPMLLLIERFLENELSILIGVI